MDTVDPNQTKNRCPTGLEREELIKWATRDREELYRISEEIKSNDHRIKDHTAAIHDYEEALNVTLSLRKGTETKAEANIKAYHLFSRHRESDVDNITSNVNEGTNKGTLTLLETLRIRDNTLAFNYKEKGDLESTLIHLNLRIERIESEVEATRSILTFIRSRNDTLAIQRNAIEIDLSKKLDLLSVRRYIPTEIWRDIFALRVVDDERLFRLGGRIGLPPFTALRLSAVCQYWRSVAFNHQQLWEFIAIRNEFKARIEPRLKHYLSKLEDRLPLVYTYSNRPSRADWANVSALLSRYTPNCRSLDITVDVPQMMRRFFLPSLTVEMEELLLRKQLTDQEDIYVYKQLIQNTKSISCHKVQLCLENNFAVDPQFQPSDEDFLQLETLVFTDCNLEVDKLIRLCSEAPELSHLDIKGSNIDFGSSNDVPTGVTLQSLKKLSLQSTHLTAFNYASLTPNLSEVDMTCNEGIKTDWDHFIAVGFRSQTIQTLTLRKGNISQAQAETYEWIMKSLVKPKHLCVYGSPGEEELSLTAEALAHIESLTLHECDVEEIELINLLTEVYSTRRNRISLVFHRCRNIDSPIAGRLAGLGPAPSPEASD
ncbi:hypothetical protein FRC16_003986 [Serendipita sp. 398]|nr:hypothetical protein FRC16_003986 [Serendipita sp. 398]